VQLSAGGHDGGVAGEAQAHVVVPRRFDVDLDDVGERGGPRGLQILAHLCSLRAQVSLAMISLSG
jgi:hypothetical protein